jgi:metallopeptidase family M12-like protein
MTRLQPVACTKYRRSLVAAAAFLTALVNILENGDGARAQSPVAPRPEKIVLSPRHPEGRGPGRIAIGPDAAAWHRLFNAGSARVADFPLPNGQRVDLEVASVDVVGGRTRFFVGNGESVNEVAGPTMRFFRGKVAGDPESLVSLNLFGGRIAGFVRYDGHEYTFGPRAYSVDRDGADDIEMVDQAAETGPRGRCDGDDVAADGGVFALSATPDLAESSTAGIDANTLLLGRIAVEGTVEWVTKLGGVAAATTYTLNLMAQVSAIYENDIKVQLQVPYILMNAAEPDGYTGSSNSTSTILGEMRTKWNGTPSLQNVFRTAAHVFSTYPSGGAGRAYINVLCSNVPVNTNAYDYGVSLLEGNGASWERQIVAHEIGHNFSSPHSHCYAPTLDDCYNTETGCYSGPVVQTTGTLMSYCNARLSSFHQRERDEKIRPGAEAAYPSCMDIAGMPGEAGGLMVGDAGICSAGDLVADDGATNGLYAYAGTIQGAWIKRFTPSCYPFKLTGVDVRITNTTTVAPGRAIRVLVYTDPAGTGTPARATLATSQDTTVQVVGAGTWNQYTLTNPVILNAGDYYIGFYDLVADTSANYLEDYDSSRSGDSWWQGGSTDPATYALFTSASGTWMIRGHGGGVNPGSVVLTWDLPCNDAAVPNQDYAVYQGAVGDWTDLTSLTCTTGRNTTWLVEDPPPDSYWIVVPQNSANEGSYGQTSSGERPPALSACKPQAIGVCQ